MSKHHFFKFQATSLKESIIFGIALSAAVLVADAVATHWEKPYSTRIAAMSVTAVLAACGVNWMFAFKRTNTKS